MNSEDFTFPLMFEHKNYHKLFLVANDENYLSLCADIQRFFNLDGMPHLWVTWAPESGMGDDMGLCMGNMLLALRLLRMRGGVDKIHLRVPSKRRW